jgi:hypothetical protein
MNEYVIDVIYLHIIVFIIMILSLIVIKNFIRKKAGNPYINLVKYNDSVNEKIAKRTDYLIVNLLAERIENYYSFRTVHIKLLNQCKRRNFSVSSYFIPF